jgi:hypothetical protein
MQGSTMTSDQFIGWALGLLALAASGLIKAHFDLRRDFSAFQLDASKDYANTADIAKIEKTIEQIQGELRTVLECLYEIRADLRAGNLHDRTRNG